MEPSSDSSYTLYGVDGEGGEKTSKKSYLQTSTPFVRPKLSARMMGNLSNESLNVSNVPQEISLEVSSITEQPSQTTNQNSTLSIHGNSDSLLLHTGERHTSQESGGDPSLPSDSKGDMNRGFYDTTAGSEVAVDGLSSPDNMSTSLKSDSSPQVDSLNAHTTADGFNSGKSGDAQNSNEVKTTTEDKSNLTSTADLDPPASIADVDPPTSIADVDPPTSIADLEPPTSIADVDPPVSIADVDPPTYIADVDPPTYIAGDPVIEVDTSVQAFLNKSFTETEFSESDLTLVQTSERMSILEKTELTRHMDDAGTGVAKSSSSSSIYLDDGVSEVKRAFKPNKRLTMAERARLEALASFGGAGLGSVEVKKRDLQTKLNREVEEQKRVEKDNHPETKMTRLQSAKQASQVSFKDIAFGDGVKHHGRNVLPSFRRQAALSPGDSNGRGGKKYLTRLQRAKAEANEAFAGAPLDSLSASGQRKRQLPTDHTDGSEPKKPKRMTRVERGRMEALQSFGGSNLRDTLDTSKKRVAQTLEAKRDKPAEEESGEDQDKENNDNVCM